MRYIIAERRKALLSEKIYSLRKKKGISQEELAFQIDVSRQAVSKWESGASVPESSKLIALSEYFNVSVDYLIKDDAGEIPVNGETEKKEKAAVPEKDIPHNKKAFAGLLLSISGAAGMLIWGLISIFSPSVSDRISGSSVITVNGSGILLICCAAAVTAGAVILLKGRK